MYGDTDTIVYIHRPGLPDPLLGDYLGDFKDESSNGDYIVEFASPKVKKGVKCAVCPSTVKGPVK